MIEPETKNPALIMDKLNRVGIKGFIIITKDGIPVIERIYDKTLDLGTDTFLTAGFLSAFARFADEHVSGLLSDIGLHTYRLFFDYTEHLMFLLIYDEIKMSNLPVTEFLMLFKGTMSEIKSTVREFFIDENFQGGASLNQIVESPKLLEGLSSMLEKVSPQFDRILYKSHKMLMDVLKG